MNQKGREIYKERWQSEINKSRRGKNWIHKEKIVESIERNKEEEYMRQSWILGRKKKKRRRGILGKEKKRWTRGEGWGQNNNTLFQMSK